MKKIILSLLVVFVVVFVSVAVFIFTVAFMDNIKADQEVRVFIPAGTSADGLSSILADAGVLRSEKSFQIMTSLRSSRHSAKPGSYLLEPGMNNHQIFSMFTAGRQSPVRVTFNNIRTIEELAGKVGGQIEADSASLSEFFADEANYGADGFNRQTIISVFIPDTYQLYWSTDAEGFYRRMLREYRSFWNNERTQEAADINLTPVGVSVLASIIDEEVVRDDEKPRIAGVYLNRLRKGIPLQADPTVKFAVNDFTIRRVLNEHLKVDSPYNTYKYKGLPPGPVCCPTKSGIEAVLNAEKHDYLYFVARPDGSGYHHFSLTLAEHNRYAAAYRRELNRRRIYK